MASRFIQRWRRRKVPGFPIGSTVRPSLRITKRRLSKEYLNMLWGGKRPLREAMLKSFPQHDCWEA